MSGGGRDAPTSASHGCRSRSPPANPPKDPQKLEISYIELNKERARQKEWKKLIRDMVFQRGKIPLLLAVEAGNQSMVRELLSAQTAEQLKVCGAPVVAAARCCVPDTLPTLVMQLHSALKACMFYLYDTLFL